MSNPKQQPPKRRAPWQNVERHYCAICNAWMGSNRQSIMLHENGKKHQENSERALLNKRMEKKQEEQAKKFLADSVRLMEQSALLQQQLQPVPVSSSSVSYPSSQHLPDRQWTSSLSATTLQQLPPPQEQQPKQQPKSSGNNKQHQLKEWQTRKKQREEEQLKKQKEQTGQEDDLELYRPVTKRHKTIDPDHGHYNMNGTTYLEGQVFAGILESDMPVQLWTGSNLATPQERILPANSMYWKNALILTVDHPTLTPKQCQTNDTTFDLVLPPIVHVTYLATVDSPEETIEKNVALDRIRIQLGADPSIPNTLEEARLLAMGGEEIVETTPQHTDEQAMVLEATGLSGWSTVSVKKTTIRQYDKEEKQRAAEMMHQERRKQEVEKRRLEERRLEEAKVSNADDSALGAYDVWGKGDYKGIDISKDVTLSIDDTAKKLSTSHPTSGTISFRKTKKKINQGKQRRKLNLDD